MARELRCIEKWKFGAMNGKSRAKCLKRMRIADKLKRPLSIA
jgi:hypothetical protein